MIERIVPNGSAPLHLRVGQLEATLIDGALHHVRFAEIELVRSVYVAVRDRRWATVPGVVGPTVERRQASAVDLVVRADHDNGDAAFSWVASIHLDDAGVCRFSVAGTVERAFWRNRIGICVLHPLHLAGRVVEIRSPQGNRTSRLPVDIAPIPPIPELVGLRWPDIDGIDLELTFDGEVFGLEDQRNWTDASFKTFGTPLSRPFPVLVPAGTEIRQSVTIHAVPTRPRSRPPNQAQSKTPRRTGAAPESLHISTQAAGAVPRIGVAFDDAPLSNTGADRLAALSVDHLRVLINRGETDWEARLASGVDAARRSGAHLDLDVIDSTGGDRIGSVLEAAAPALAEASRIFVYAGPHDAHATTAALLQRARVAFGTSSSGGRLGGGTLRNYYDFAVRPIPYRKLDVATYSINPQMHTYDDESILESVLSLPATLRGARRRCGQVPLAIGPVSLRPRRTDASSAPAVAGLPPWVDPRQGSSLTALYALGTVSAFSRPGVESLTIFEASGMAGMIFDPVECALDPSLPRPDPSPSLLEVLFGALPSPGSRVVETDAPPDIVALASVGDGMIVALIGNASSKERTIALHAPRSDWGNAVNIVGEGTKAAYGSGRRGAPVLRLGPRSIVRIDGTATDRGRQQSTPRGSDSTRGMS